MRTLLNAALLLTLVPATARGQINAGEQKPEWSLPLPKVADLVRAGVWRSA